MPEAVKFKAERVKASREVPWTQTRVIHRDHGIEKLTVPLPFSCPILVFWLRVVCVLGLGHHQ
jgi:hypothetical protein